MHTKYRRFNNVDEAVCWGKKYYSNWLPNYQIGKKLRFNYETENPERFFYDNLSEKEINEIKKEALENKWFSYYCGGNYGLAINQIQRYGYTEYLFLEDELKNMRQVMDSCLEKSFIPENILGYRFLNYSNLCSSIRKHSIHYGDIIEDKGYMGVGLVKTALEKEFGTYDTLLKILIPKDANGIYIDLISNRVDEQEIVFARGSKLKVLFKYKWRGKKTFICKMLE